MSNPERQISAGVYLQMIDVRKWAVNTVVSSLTIAFASGELSGDIDAEQVVTQAKILEAYVLREDHPSNPDFTAG